MLGDGKIGEQIVNLWNIHGDFCVVSLVTSALGEGAVQKLGLHRLWCSVCEGGYIEFVRFFGNPFTAEDAEDFFHRRDAEDAEKFKFLRDGVVESRVSCPSTRKSRVPGTPRSAKPAPGFRDDHRA